MEFEEYSLIDSKNTSSSYDNFHINVKCSCGAMNYIPDNGKDDDVYCDRCYKKLTIKKRRCCILWF